MSCQVCRRMICRCGPDQAYAIRAERNALVIEITRLNTALEKAAHALQLIALGGNFCNQRETAMMAYNEIKRAQKPEETPGIKGSGLQ